MTVVLQRWQHDVTEPETAVILPDGCRDLILVQPKDRAPYWSLSSLQSCSERVPLRVGSRMTGFRLAPGALVPKDLLRDLPRDADAAFSEIESGVTKDTRAAEALSVMQHAATVAEAAKTCGVSARSLQRVLVRETGHAPAFWLRLSRTRRAALRIMQPLVDVAVDCGFADQSHLSREFRHWFGVSPRQLREEAGLRHQLAQPALATGVQISMR